MGPSSHMQALDRNALQPELRSLVPGFGDIRAVTKFASGQSNPTYLVETPDKKYVLRAKPPGKLLKSAHQVDREYRVMKALGTVGFPVPNVLALSNEDSAIGRMYYLMEFVDGRIFWDPALPDLDNGQRGAVYRQMNSTLAMLHDVDLKRVGLDDFGRPGNYYARQIGRWSQQYKLSETGVIPAMDRLMGWLVSSTPEDDGQVSLVHGDYRIDNMIFAPERPEVLAVLDWELSTLGHPIADLAYQCMQWRLPNDGPFKGLAGIDRQRLNLPSEEDYVAEYCANRRLNKIDNWPFYLAFSFFRIAAILQGVAKRALDGNASNPERARVLGEAVPLLADMALQVIDEDGA